MELKEKTSLSSRTLAKHLNRMTNLQIIERKKDVRSKKYPVPVLYKATHELLTYLEVNIRELKEQIAELQALQLPVTRLFHELMTERTPEEQAKYEQWLRQREIEEQKYTHSKPRRSAPPMAQNRYAKPTKTKKHTNNDKQH